MSDYAMSNEEVRVMRHALGLRNKRKRPYRNYYTAEDSPVWNGLVGRGLATVTTQTSEIWLVELKFYRVTHEGRMALRALGYWAFEKEPSR